MLCDYRVDSDELQLQDSGYRVDSDDVQVLDGASDDADECATDIDQDLKSLQMPSPGAASPKSLGGVQPWWMRQADSSVLASIPARNPMPNYSAEFVQAHNPDLADRFEGAASAYLNDLCSTVEMLRVELAKLPSAT